MTLTTGLQADASTARNIVLGKRVSIASQLEQGIEAVRTFRTVLKWRYTIINTSGRRAIEDSRDRRGMQYKVHYDTTLNGGTAMALNADA